mgnify:CR=1 FL=1|jgi:hypothetical protein|tara:strand:- start:154 stop:258 length:105 start_codon:yes stop_codon:yes gene_type:complete
MSVSYGLGMLLMGVIAIVIASVIFLWIINNNDLE